MMHADAAANTRDMTAAADGERVVRCILKKGDSIAAQRCLDTQEEDLCFCPAAYGALKGTETLLGPNAHPNDGEAIAQLSKQRIRLSMLKARAAGFAKKEQEYSGPALSLINAELQRRAKERAAKGPAPVPATGAKVPVRVPLSTATSASASFTPDPPTTEPKGAVGGTSSEEKSPSVGPNGARICIGAKGVACPKTRVLRVNSFGDRCHGCRRAQLGTQLQPCTKCSRPSSSLSDGICGRCIYAARQRDLGGKGDLLCKHPEGCKKKLRADNATGLCRDHREFEYQKKRNAELSAAHKRPEIASAIVPISAQPATEVALMDTKVSPKRPEVAAVLEQAGIVPNPAHGTVYEDGLRTALRNLGFPRKLTTWATDEALRTHGTQPFAELMKEALRLIRDPPVERSASAKPERALPAVRFCSYEGCKEPINAGNKSNRCGPHSRINRKRSTPAGLKTCPKCFRKRYALRESGVCGTCDSSSHQRVMDRTCVHPEGCKEGITRWNKSGLCPRHASRERVKRHYAAARELREKGIQADANGLPDPRLLPHDYLVVCVEEAMRRREAFTKALFPNLPAHAPGEDLPDGVKAAQSVVPASVGKAAPA